MKRLPSLPIFFLLLAISLLFIITCKKEYSYEGGRTAEYTFVGAPDICIEPILFGTYTVGVSTADSVNYVDLHINVTSPGSLAVTTNVVDGISFSTGALNSIDTAY